MENFNALSVKPDIFSFNCLVASSPLAIIASTSSAVKSVTAVESKMCSAPNRTIFAKSSLLTDFWFCCKRPCWITKASKANFLYAFSMTFSSTELSVQNRKTETSFFWPMRCALSMACKSICGFQSESYKMTVSAVAKLIPKPPARVDKRNTNFSEFGLLYSSIESSRIWPSVLPSILQYW